MYVYCRTIVGVASLSDLYTSTGFSILLWLQCNVNFISHHYITNQTAPHHYFHVSHSTISRRRDWFKIADDPAMLEYYGICSWAITIFCSTPTFWGCQYWPELSLNCSESNFIYLSRGLFILLITPVTWLLNFTFHLAYFHCVCMELQTCKTNKVGKFLILQLRNRHHSTMDNSTQIAWWSAAYPTGHSTAAANLLAQHSAHQQNMRNSVHL